MFFGGFYGHNDPISPLTQPHPQTGDFALKPSQIAVNETYKKRAAAYQTEQTLAK